MPDTIITPTPVPDRAARYGVTYRQVLPADTAFLKALYRSTRESELARTGWDEAARSAFIDFQFNAQDRHYSKHYNGAAWLIIEQDGARVGRLYLSRWAQEDRIVDIILHADVRGQGLGAAILRDLQDAAASANRLLSIHVEKENPALALYERLGFERVEDKSVYWLMHWRTSSSPESAAR